MTLARLIDSLRQLRTAVGDGIRGGAVEGVEINRDTYMELLLNQTKV